LCCTDNQLVEFANWVKANQGICGNQINIEYPGDFSCAYDVGIGSIKKITCPRLTFGVIYQSGKYMVSHLAKIEKGTYGFTETKPFALRTHIVFGSK